MDNFDFKKYLSENKLTENTLKNDIKDFLDSIDIDNYQRSKDNDPDYEEVEPTMEFFLDMYPEYEGREDEIMPFLNENWQSLGISITPQENAEEMIVSLGSKRLAAQVVDEILNIEVLQEPYKEYWREVKSEILNNN